MISNPDAITDNITIINVPNVEIDMNNSRVVSSCVEVGDHRMNCKTVDTNDRKTIVTNQMRLNTS
jgi:hypothetical protein